MSYKSDRPPLLNDPDNYNHIYIPAKACNETAAQDMAFRATAVFRYFDSLRIPAEQSYYRILQ